MDIPKAWIEAGAESIARASDAMAGWNHSDPSAQKECRDDYRKQATACLAAVFGRAEVVEHTCDRTYSPVNRAGVALGPEFDVAAGDTLMIVRGW